MLMLRCEAISLLDIPSSISLSTSFSRAERRSAASMFSRRMFSPVIESVMDEHMSAPHIGVYRHKAKRTASLSLKYMILCRTFTMLPSALIIEIWFVMK